MQRHNATLRLNTGHDMPAQGAIMRNAFLVSVLLAMAAVALWAQSSTQAAPTAKPSTAAKMPVQHSAATGKPIAVIETSAGNLTCSLFPDKAPIGVENFIGLATGTKDWKNPVSGATKHGVPLYDGTIFHRVIPEFMIQGGDPSGTGSGEIGFQFKDELHPDLLFDKPGRLAYANSGPNTNGSQFFVTETAQPGLNPCFDDGGCQRGNRMVPKGTGYTIFGQCDEATVALVKVIAHKATDPSNNRPFRPVKIEHIKIVREGAAAAKPATPAKKPASATPAKPPASN
jgi:peptidyl-prolyl cis-trans isomerase A (cyclophilin A)